MSSELTPPEEYDDPAGYDLENGLDGPELPFYLPLAQATGGPVLDLACGTGFLTIPLARLGLAVTGVDIAANMLEHARGKAGDLPIRWLHADCRTLDLGERFGLITMTGNAFQAFITRADQEGLLGSVVRHLAPDGRFAFETRFPRPSTLFAIDVPAGAWSAEEVWRTFVDEHGRTVTVATSQRHDPLRQTVDYALYRRHQDGDRTETHTSHTTLRFVYPQEMAALLHYNDLAIEHAYGDWDRRPLAGDSPRMIYVCRLRAAVG